MKFSLITLVATTFIGCAATTTGQTAFPSMTLAAPSEPVSVDANTHLVWCRGKVENCYIAADTFCSPDKDTNSQHMTPGKWEQVSDSPDMAFPAMIQDADGWRFFIRCL